MTVRRCAVLSSLLLLTACDEVDDTTSDAVDHNDVGDTGASTPDTTEQPDVPMGPFAFCEGGTHHRYDPFEAEELLLFPDNAYLREDETSPTGWRVDLEESRAPWIAEVPQLLENVTNDMQVLSGFGSNAGIVLRFDAPVTGFPPLAEGSATMPGVYLVDLSTSPPTRIPYEYVNNDQGLDAILWPLRPLALGVQHALIITTDFNADDGGCIAPSDATQAILEDPSQFDDARAQRLSDEWHVALRAMRIAPDNVSAITTFRVHDGLGPMVDAAAAIHANEAATWGPTTCEPWGEGRRCETSIVAEDYRENRFVQSAIPQGEWTLPVTVWLPGGPGPYPVLFYGHGLNGERGQGREVAEEVATLGMAVIASDAMGHGDHVTAPEGSALPALDFLGIDLSEVRLEALALRGNFDQTVLDRLQVIRSAVQHTDIDSDGVSEFDGDNVAYWGISLGGMLGSGVTALSQDIDISILSVAGGRLLTFATDTQQVDDAMPLLLSFIGSEALFQRLIPVAQSLVDPSDPATFATGILRGAFHDSDPPHVLLPVALKDETVPPSTGRALARALGAPHIGEIFEPVAIPRGNAPIRGNIDGETTAGFMQYDRVIRRGEPVEASHGNMPVSDEALEQNLHFLQTWLMGATPELIDPYFVRGTPALVE